MEHMYFKTQVEAEKAQNDIFVKFIPKDTDYLGQIVEQQITLRWSDIVELENNEGFAIQLYKNETETKKAVPSFTMIRLQENTNKIDSAYDPVEVTKNLVDHVIAIGDWLKGLLPYGSSQKSV